ncbi:thiamine pyrophosphate-binding protein [Arcobacter sp. LA11]|uniref:thiamine pyrophosphate-binding protein n=1 Tax=Arcobacter sp. LA11 TaxID=1898176 RepID=UPI000934046B|nr:thiamine pyrophosphate-binding protein [Arcobacter sp. LA11]
MIKVSDYVAKFLAENEQVGTDIFMVSGGGNMHLIDSIGKNESLNYVCNHHEQACTFAAEGYARVSNKIGVSFVTTGPGGTNAITGVYSAWVDSIPTFTISGQVKFMTTISSQPELNLRQLGDQEINIIDLVKPITKYAVLISDKNTIKYHLEKALYLAKEGRPGPVWLDIPLDIQGAMIDEKDLESFSKPIEKDYDIKMNEVLDLLSKSKRPVIIAGNGITLSDGNETFINLVKDLNIPIVSSFARYDILNDEHPLFFGRFGTIGQRAANFIVQNSDCIIAIGARLNIRAISYNWEHFGRAAKKILIDIDKAELNKHTLDIDIKIESDAKYFIKKLHEEVKNNTIYNYDNWINRCKKYKSDFPTIIKQRQEVKDYVDSYNFFDLLSNVTKDNEVFVFANATASVSSYQSLRTKGKQKIIENSGCAAMGYDLPAAIGACYANNKNDVICVTGDGSLQMNIQELQTIIHNKLPIKIFVLNNEGYSSIKNTQNNFFNGHKVGSEKSSGVSFPNLEAISKAYGFKTFKIKNQNNLQSELEEILKYKSFVCEIMLDPNEKMEPKLSSEIKEDGTIISKPLEDMFPFLDRELFNKNMIIETIGE